MAKYPEAIDLGQTPNSSGNFRSGEPKFLVQHYTAGGGGEGSAKFLFSPHSPASSAHFVVDRDGKVWQLSDTGKITWHAGRSLWRGISMLNSHAIGIEYANYGYWRAGIPKFDEPLRAKHKNGGPELLWEHYPEEQILSGLKLSAWILSQHKTIREIVGHDDIAPGRKSDPGPAFPMHRFQDLLLPDSETKNIKQAKQKYAVNATVLNVRGGAGTQFEKLDWGPLKKGDIVWVLQQKADWDYVESTKDHQGWVSGQYLTPAR
jgi:N-acetylmuramoyl-L-alanine amidase